MIKTQNEVNPPVQARVVTGTRVPAAHRLLRQGAATSIQAARLSQALGWWVPSHNLRRRVFDTPYAA